MARREHDAFVEVLAGLGPTVHVLEAETDDPDLIYPFDPLLVTDRGAIPLRPGKPNRADEPDILEAWTEAAGIPTLGRIEPPGTIEGGDTFWLRPDLFCVGRTLRSNASGVFQLADLVGGDVRVFDVPYWKGPAELIHLMSVISPVADDLAVVYLPLLPVGPVGAAGRSRHPSRRGAGCGVPDARVQCAGRQARRGHHGRRKPRDGGCPGRGRLRSAHLSGDPDRDQRIGWADVHDATDPS